MYALGGEAECPVDAATYAETKSTVGLTVEDVNEESLEFRLASVLRRWLALEQGATLCWVLPNCVENNPGNGSRPCGSKLGNMQWRGGWQRGPSRLQLKSTWRVKAIFKS